MEYEISDDPQGEYDLPDGDRDGGVVEDHARLRRKFHGETADDQDESVQPDEEPRAVPSLVEASTWPDRDTRYWRTGWDSNPRWA